MFINCPHCGALVATDPATDLPPTRCPRCAVKLRDGEPQPAEAAPLASGEAVDAVPAPTAALAEAIIATNVPSSADADDDAKVATTAAGGSASDAPIPEAATLPANDEAAALERMRATADATHDRESAADAAVDPPAEAAHEHLRETPVQAPPPSTPDPQSQAGPDLPDPEAVPAMSPVAEDESTAALRQERTAAAGAATSPVRDDDAAHAPGAAAAVGPPVAGAAPASARRDKPAPSFARVRTPVAAANARRRWTLPSLIAALTVLLALQWILADRARLAADPDWRPFLAQLCATLRCELPPWREPTAFALLERDVRPHPDVPGALRVNATFRNDARWPQPWPQVVLTLSDVDGRAIGARAFAAGEYLGGAPTQNELASGQTATIRMDILEPAPPAVAFAFDFR